MKKCNFCGMENEDGATVCTSCGYSDFSYASNKQQTENSDGQTREQYSSPSDSTMNPEQPVTNPAEAEIGNGNILAGIVGAFLFSIIGGLLYFVIYQVGFIAGICGLVIFILANFGYGLFARTKNKQSVVGLISAIAATIVMIFVAEYACISYEIFIAFKEYDVTIFDAVRATPEFLTDPEIGKAFAGDLAMAYIFGFIATIGNIVNVVKAVKNKDHGVN